MMRPGFRPLLLALLALGAPTLLGAAVLQRPIRFSGEVRQGQRFERVVTGGLRFRIAPLPGDPSGFAIQVVQADTATDYVAIATPPYHGVNDAVIEAWHFRNADNSGPNQGEVNAPQERREVRFVTNRRDFERFKENLDLVLRPSGARESSVDSAMAAMSLIPCGTAIVSLRDLQLGNLGQGLQPVIERMGFEVRLTLPSRAPRRR
jgi:hypothetical protein